jgi:hypothetical protein
MKVGIVGAEAAKFTQDSAARTRAIIKSILEEDTKQCMSHKTTLVSGGCHLGGADIYAEEMADELGLEKLIFKPRELNWSHGYKPRNLQIAHSSDILYNIVVDKLPEEYKGMSFKVCYHCAKAGKSTEHIKSGGCWTALKTIELRKPAFWIVIKNYDT